ncbi:serine hydrolase [Patescibacteria group bacterium]|nr:serine hydrolase [Patescibacteria group bacterium]
MMPFVYGLVILVLSVNAVLGIPKIVSLVQAKINPPAIPNNLVLGEHLVATASAAPVVYLPISKNIPPPTLTANAALVEDLNHHFLLYVKDPAKRVPIASTTKIMTALIATEYYQADDILTVTPEASVSGSAMGLQLNEKISFINVLYGMLLNSGNDAAFTLAANYPGGVSAFVDAMNEKATQMNLTNTHFDNPAGFDSPQHYSSAADLAKIAESLTQNSLLSKIVATKEMTVYSVDYSVAHQLKNLNILLDLPGVKGIKTGYTPAAKENFVGLIKRDNQTILTVVLGSDDRFGETENLFDWTFNNFVFQ